MKDLRCDNPPQYNGCRKQAQGDQWEKHYHYFFGVIFKHVEGAFLNESNMYFEYTLKIMDYCGALNLFCLARCCV